MLVFYDVIAPYIRPVSFLVNLTVVVTAVFLLYKGQVPEWHKRIIWAMAFGCMVICATLVMGYYYGRQHPLSYYQIGIIPELWVNGCIALIGVVFTVRYLRGAYKPPTTVRTAKRNVAKKAVRKKAPVVITKTTKRV